MIKMAAGLCATLALSCSAKAGTAIAEGGFVLPPLAFTKFCLAYPGECGGGAARVRLDAARLKILQEVNRQVNLAIAPLPAAAPPRDWTLDVAQGDCNAYAVQKRHELMRRGWPPGALALSVVRTRAGVGHLVVTVRTDAGDLVLDNLRQDIVEWRQTDYRWVMRQSQRNPMYWVTLDGARIAEAPRV